MQNSSSVNFGAPLRAKLESYEAISRVEARSGKSAREIAGYAAAAGAALAMAGNADATVIYSGVQNLVAQIDPAHQFGVSYVNGHAGYSVNFQNFSVNGVPFMAGAVIAAELGTNINNNAGLAAKYIGAAVVQGSGVQFVAGSSSPLGLATPVAPGAAIGAGSNQFGGAAGAVRMGVGYANGKTVQYGNLLLGDNLFGFALPNGNFGWIRLNIEDLGLNQPFSDILQNAVGISPLFNGQGFPDRITVVDWAYDDQGRTIFAGTLNVPEPGALSLLAAGAAGIATMRRRKLH